MLIVKVIEGFVRIFAGIGFDKSKHVVDSGLVGVCGLLGCCGGRRRRHPSTRRRYRATEVPRDAASEISSYMPPAAILAQKELTPSNHSQPPSVLRPEHALQPYREDSDDESGYIMGAWQPFPRPGYNTVDGSSSTQGHPNTSATSGFSRVGGGRATFDTPYAIATGSTLTFPSAHSAAPVPPIKSPSSGHEHDLPAAVANVARQPQQPHLDLPPGAMPPHNRTRSQSAIVEDFITPSPYLTPPSPPAAVKSSRRASAAAPDESANLLHPRKKPWYHIRRSRRHSDGGATVRDEHTADPAPEPERSFVVIRNKRPSSSRRLDSEASGSVTTNENTPKEMPTSSVVERGNNSG